MWVYEKKLQYPVKVSTCNPTLAKYLIEQYGGADGEPGRGSPVFEPALYDS